MENKVEIIRVCLCILMLAGLLRVLGCDNEETFEARVSEVVPKGFIKGKAKIVGGVNEGHFTHDDKEATLECVITVIGTVDGNLITKSVNVTLKATGPEGAYYKLKCDDPMVIQFPADANNFIGTFDDGMGTYGPLIITSGLSTIPVGHSETLDSEPGQQIVTVSLPDGLAPGLYDISLEFDLDTSRDIEIKPLIAAELTCAGDTFFPPTVPCGVTSFADLPAVTIPMSDSFVPISPPLDGIDQNCEFFISCLGCSGVLVGDWEEVGTVTPPATGGDGGVQTGDTDGWTLKDNSPSTLTSGTYTTGATLGTYSLKVSDVPLNTWWSEAMRNDMLGDDMVDTFMNNTMFRIDVTQLPGDWTPDPAVGWFANRWVLAIEADTINLPANWYSADQDPKMMVDWGGDLSKLDGMPHNVTFDYSGVFGVMTGPPVLMCNLYLINMSYGFLGTTTSYYVDNARLTSSEYPPVCGDGTCNGGETCSTCPQDCGPAPTGDFTGDCKVNWYDVKVMSEEWLSEDVEADIYEDEDNIVNFRDFAVLAGHWLEESL